VASTAAQAPAAGGGLTRKRVSEHYSLGVGQDALDFVDADIWGDDPLYIDPRALRTLRTTWTDECVMLLQDFFGTVIAKIRDGKHDEARMLLGQLREPNETHLGLSTGVSRGRALGPGSVRNVWDALVHSEAVKSGLLEELEETVLMIEGISFDIVSDIATNVIRAPLIAFTQEQCAAHNIPTRNVASGPLWDPETHTWMQRFEQLPVAGNGKLLLVPKVIVRKRLHFNADDYFQHYILDYLQEQEIAAKTELVYLLKDGTPRVDKKALIAKYGRSKRLAVEITKNNPTILDQYRRDKRKHQTESLDHQQLANQMPGTQTPNWDKLLDDVTSIEPGKAGAGTYHKAIEALLKALFHPDLAFPERETAIHGGRKRIDITFANQVTGGFFKWVAAHHPAMYIVIECKNYTGDPANPELDQVSGRFSPTRGKIGFLVCRSFEDKDLFIQRCRDTASDQRGFVIPLDDDDLTEMVEARKLDQTGKITALLKTRFEQLIR
jgi:hypothetical protein